MNKLLSFLNIEFLIKDNALKNWLHFFDRGIIDSIAYLKKDGLPINNELKEITKTYRYSTTVFYTPIWKEIYINDAERKEDITTAIEIEKTLLDTYTSVKKQSK